MNDFIEIAEGLWYETTTGLPWSSKVNTGRSGVPRYDGELKRLHNNKSNGYFYVRIKNKMKQWHRLVWEHFNGSIPSDKIVEHFNNDRTDNRLSNLQLESRTYNSQKCKKQKNNTTGYAGVGFNKASNKFRARIEIDGKRKHLGLFDTPEEASKAYI